MDHPHRVEASVDAALRRTLGVLLTPLVIGAGLLAARGGPGGVWGFAVLLAVLAVAAVVVAAGVRGLVRRVEVEPGRSTDAATGARRRG